MSAQNALNVWRLRRKRNLFAKHLGGVVSSVLGKAGLAYLASNVTYMMYPNDTSRSAGNRHYLYDPTTNTWTATGSTIDGTMNANGTISGGAGTHTITPPETCIYRVQTRWLSSGVRTPILELGFNRELTSDELLSLNSSVFHSGVCSGSGVDPATCNTVTVFTRGSDIVNVAGRVQLVSGELLGSIGPETAHFVNTLYTERIRSNGNISSASLYLLSGSDTTLITIQIEVWRKTGATFDLVGTSADFSSQLSGSAGIHTVSFAPITGVLAGDYVGVKIVTSGYWMRFSAIAAAGSSMRYTYAEVGTTNEDIDGWNGLSYVTAVQCFGQAPSLVAIGDSIVQYHDGLIGISAPDQTYGICPNIFALDSLAVSQNMGIGGQTTTQIHSRFTTDCINLKPKLCIIEGGVNDLDTGVEQSTYISKITSMIDSCISAGIVPVVCKILPWTNGSNLEMQSRDAWSDEIASIVNESYPTCVWVDADSALGEFRAGGDTGNLWNLKSSYTFDGVHLTESGYDAWADCVYGEICKKYGFVR